MERKKVENRIRELREMHNYTREGMVEMLCEGLRREKTWSVKVLPQLFFSSTNYLKVFLLYKNKLPLEWKKEIKRVIIDK